ncbi:hypothetical protein MILUP08_42763 [Micromonospora lupini str. Lupac 08]|uniref:Uncharacterized protein n=1 Tax=Micromonospora lupini str. Lupac 08 TaxID=1150864 RepID=I0L1Y5_9ACTN|nr:hypothetical protein MILUP08_42763 [Micromonospora lupini str. Lupac 08]
MPPPCWPSATGRPVPVAPSWLRSSRPPSTPTPTTWPRSRASTSPRDASRLKKATRSMTFLQNGPERTRPSACREHAFTRARRTNQSLSISLSIASGGTSWTGPQGTREVGAQAEFGAALPGSVATTPLLGWLILQATWANVLEHAAGPPDYWGSRGRRFESGRPDRLTWEDEDLLR